MTGAAAGFTPAQINSMTLWEFACVVEGFAAFHGAKPSAQPSAEYSDDQLRSMGVEGF